MSIMHLASLVEKWKREELRRERIEARRAETTKIGSVHESRAEGLAHPFPPIRNSKL